MPLTKPSSNEVDISRHATCGSPSVSVLSDRPGLAIGLTVVHPHARVAASHDRFVIDALLAARGRDPGWLREYERRTGESALTPVGEAARVYLIMYMGPSGHVYRGYGDFLVCLGPPATTRSKGSAPAGKHHTLVDQTWQGSVPGPH